MVDITVQEDRVTFRVEGLHQLWAFRSELEIPLAHIVGVDVSPEQVGTWWHGFKLIGTDVPGLFAAGTFLYHGELVFGMCVIPSGRSSWPWPMSGTRS